MRSKKSSDRIPLIKCSLRGDNLQQIVGGFCQAAYAAGWPPGYLSRVAEKALAAHNLEAAIAILRHYVATDNFPVEETWP